MHSDGKKRRSFLALLFAAGDLRRWASQFIRASLDLKGDSHAVQNCSLKPIFPRSFSHDRIL
jgi:hypothetical protein